MSKYPISTGLWLACAALGCGDNQDPEGAQALWSQIHALNYRSWQRAPGYEQRRATNAPHGEAVEIFVNEVVTQARNDELAASWPTGSLIVKDGWDGNTLELVAVMEKRASGWYWAEYDGSGDAAYSGSPSICIDCHQSGADFIRAFGLPLGP